MALQIDEPQVLLLYEDGEPPWHHRVLLRRLQDASWVVVTPDLDVQVGDLASFTLLPLARGAAVPRHVERSKCYMFEGPIDDVLADFHAQANRIASILGVGAPGGSPVSAGSSWRVTDLALAEFAEEVPADVMADTNTGVTRGSVGLALFADPPRRVFVEKVPVGDDLAWQDEKHCGGGRDRRLGVGAPPDVELLARVTSPKSRP